MSYPNLGSLNKAQMSYGGEHPGGYGGQEAGGYPGGQPGGYGGAYAGYGGQQPGNFPPNPGHQAGVNPEVQQWFNAVDRDRSGKITAKELQAALVNGQGKNFSDEACNLMIGMFDMDKTGMFDKDKTGTIDINEFHQLYNYINQWLGTFRSYDRDQSGHIEEEELAQDNGSDLNYTSPELLFDKSKRKRKHRGDEDAPFHVVNGLNQEVKELHDQRLELESCQSNDKLRQENKKLREDMNQLINENVHLLRENKQLQEENNRLEGRLKSLCEENERLDKEHKQALELSSWLDSAREIVETFRRKPPLLTRPVRKPSPLVRPADVQSHSHSSSINHVDIARNYLESRNSRWNDADVPNTNGNFITPHIKVEQADEDQPLEGGQESPYHTPLLNFDQVEFHSPGKEVCDVPNSALAEMTEPIEDEVDKIGREQLLFPEPVEGVCELCPGSRIYVALTAMDNILSKKSHSSVARSCLEAIFKMPYLLSCSVQGNVAKGPYGKPDVQRPSLYRPAVECILKYARFHAERNGWKVEENTTIKKQMNTRLSELRNIAKYKAQAAAAADAGDAEHKGYSRYKNIVAALSALPIVAQPASTEMSTEVQE